MEFNFFPEFALEIKILIDITQLRRPSLSAYECTGRTWDVRQDGSSFIWELTFSVDDSSDRVNKSLLIKTWSRVMTVELAQV